LSLPAIGRDGGPRLTPDTVIPPRENRGVCEGIDGRSVLGGAGRPSFWA
jgi:hypothetical protein